MQAQTARFVANETVTATNTNTGGVPIQAVRDTAGNLYELTAAGAVYKLAPPCLDLTACGGTAIIPVAAGNADVAVDTTGAVYVANSVAKTVTKYTATGGVYAGSVVVTLGLGNDAIRTPAALDVDTSGYIYIGTNGASA